MIQAKAAEMSHEAGFRVWGMRYQVTDIDCAVAIYTKYLGFELAEARLQGSGRFSAASHNSRHSLSTSSRARRIISDHKILVEI